jgi:hypothetical protein
VDDLSFHTESFLLGIVVAVILIFLIFVSLFVLGGSSFFIAGNSLNRLLKIDCGLEFEIRAQE